MESQGSTPDAETQVQQPGTVQQAAAPKQHFIDRFGKGSIAVMASVAGLLVGVGGSAVVDDHGHDGWRHHRGAQFGMERGGWGGPQGGRGQGGPPPMRYGGQGGPQGGAAPGAQQQAPQAPQGKQATPKNGSTQAPPAAGTQQAY